MPYALYIGFLAPHAPLTPPEPYASMYDDLAADWARHDAKPPDDLWRRATHAWGYDEADSKHHQEIERSNFGLISTVDACVSLVREDIRNLGLAEVTCSSTPAITAT
jgi:hypothetical protein